MAQALAEKEVLLKMVEDSRRVRAIRVVISDLGVPTALATS
jgi:hypothetical protein